MTTPGGLQFGIFPMPDAAPFAENLRLIRLGDGRFTPEREAGSAMTNLEAITYAVGERHERSRPEDAARYND